MPQLFKEDYKYQPETESFNHARILHPDIALTICFIIDEGYMWDGDCEEPETPAFVANITACKVVNGLLFEGNAYLGGCYPLEDEDLDFEVSGYSPQLIKEAISDLNDTLADCILPE